MAFLCFEPEPSLIMGRVASGASLQRPTVHLPRKLGNTILEVNIFGTTNPPFGHNGTKLHFALNVLPEVVCARHPTLRAI